MFAVSFQRSCRPLSKFVRIHPTRTGTGTRILNNTRRKNSSLTTESKEKVTQRPIRIILVRHGESLGNVDESAYVSTPDWCVPLTEKGRQQAYDAGKELSEIVGKDGKVFFYFSPYKRTRETVEQFQKHINAEQIISVREEPRISEQQFGNFQNVEEVLESKKERHVFGRFYYRFKSGEAGLDVYSRVSSFISTLVRDCQQYQKAGYDLDTINVVIVTHGLSLRLFLMRWFQVSFQFVCTSTLNLNALLFYCNEDDSSKSTISHPGCVVHIAFQYMCSFLWKSLKKVKTLTMQN